MELKKEDIEHIANLARLELSEEEKEKFQTQLSDVLSYIDQLQGLDTSSVEPTAQVTGLKNVYRADEKEDWDAKEREAAINEAPSLESGQVKVKRVL